MASAVVAPMVMRVVMSVGGGGGTGGGGEGDGGGAPVVERRAFMCVSDEFVKLEWRSRRRAFDPVFPNKGEARGRRGPLFLERFGPVQKKALCRKPLCSTRPQLEIR